MKVEANILFEVNDCSIGYQWHTVCTCDLHHRGQWRYSLWTDSISKIHGSNVCLSLGYTIYRLVVLWTQITTGVGVIAILCYSPFFQYSTYQYVAAAIIIFVSTNVLEGNKVSAMFAWKVTLILFTFTFLMTYVLLVKSRMKNADRGKLIRIFSFFHIQNQYIFLGNLSQS